MWKAAHAKVYTLEEESMRFQNFLASKDRVAQLNARAIKGGSSARYGLNKFSDMTPEEFRQFYLMHKPIKSNPTQERDILSIQNVRANPTSFDWRKASPPGVTAVKDQGQCGSCWAFSATENIESVVIVVGNKTIPALSPQQIVDCDGSDGGCNGGNPPTAYDYVVSAGGIESDADYPYTAEDGTCNFDKSKVVTTIKNWKYACGYWDEEALKTVLVNHAAPSICVDAANWQDYQSGIMTGWECAWVNTLDHCVQAVGYDMTGPTPFWIVRNSWSTGWGEKGYIRLEFGSNTCGLTNEASSAVL